MKTTREKVEVMEAFERGEAKKAENKERRLPTKKCRYVDVYRDYDYDDPVIWDNFGDWGSQ